ncbi:NADPH-dependent 7-cyano-7-deazaguanine reductase QueF [Dyella sp. GSA-30]|uniref:NADPH-dependent 7-cyano-7-deazaguanine reductase QueF n=1 Tax=Dyella sp. GSA-30 TaxID=2994496 RepID=UPI002490FEB0|nr:NADPH-dependent 7-cyano-7-deazaguanine reductase QueF [Dyella sp. GSA-30]BDU19631.1 NADPH-dependent 7-cyano-7-deazaguanine reductase [Dyella sp. GSA-30]
MTTPDHSPLGKTTIYADRYDPSLLFPIPRQAKRDEIGVDGNALPFHGLDIWNAYELSWLDTRGKPVVAIMTCHVPATSPAIIESKSFKLYLNGFAGERMDSRSALVEVLERDLSQAAGASVEVQLSDVSARDHAIVDLDGTLIDALELDIDDYGPPKSAYLHADETVVVEETLVSNLLRSNCPVTGQPDWGSVQIAYRGPRIDAAGLLRYLVSFRNHNEFHEQCVERIYVDIQRHCGPQALSVYARYTRRGGLDINPFRSSAPGSPGNPRGARQ